MSKVKNAVVFDKKKKRLFVDMDGTLTVFTPQAGIEPLYEKGYFLNLPSHENVVAAMRYIINNHPEIEVNVLSAVLMDSRFALEEKNAWLDKYLPEVDEKHRIFVPNGSDKKAWVIGFNEDDTLLDDYTPNLLKWNPARGIKLLNLINHSKGTWQQDRIRYDREPVELANGIMSIMEGLRHIYDDPIKSGEK